VLCPFSKSAKLKRGRECTLMHNLVIISKGKLDRIIFSTCNIHQLWNTYLTSTRHWVHLQHHCKFFFLFHNTQCRGPFIECYAVLWCFLKHNVYVSSVTIHEDENFVFPYFIKCYRTLQHFQMPLGSICLANIHALPYKREWNKPWSLSQLSNRISRSGTH